MRGGRCWGVQHIYILCGTRNPQGEKVMRGERWGVSPSPSPSEYVPPDFLPYMAQAQTSLARLTDYDYL